MVMLYIQEHLFIFLITTLLHLCVCVCVCVDGIGEKNSFRALYLKEMLFFKDKDHFILCICPADERKCV